MSRLQPGEPRDWLERPVVGAAAQPAPPRRAVWFAIDAAVVLVLEALLLR